MSESPESWPDVYETVLKSDIAQYQQTITSIRNQLAEAQRNVELLRGVNDEQQKRVFDLLSQRDQLKQKLAALTEALKPITETLGDVRVSIQLGDLDDAIQHLDKAETKLSELDKLCAKGD